MSVADAFWAVVITGVVLIAGMTVLAVMLLGLALWAVDALMRQLERIEPTPPLEDDEHETLEEAGRGYVRGLIAGLRNAGVKTGKGPH